METIYVYHAVTERPMKLGQKIIFNQNHHNGVFQRVMTFEKIIRGEAVSGETADLIRSDLARWAKVVYRELALEKVRREQFPGYPSRMACLYTSRSLEAAQSWAQFFKEIGRDVYAIVKLSVNGTVFDGDACNCFDGTGDEARNLALALHYWKKDVQNEQPVIETIVDGEITVAEIVEDWKAANLSK